jgi:hypothetical protein
MDYEGAHRPPQFRDHDPPGCGGSSARYISNLLIPTLHKLNCELPLLFLALHENGSPHDNPMRDDDYINFFDGTNIVLAEKVSLLLTASSIDVATMCNLTRWALIIVGSFLLLKISTYHMYAISIQ